MVEEQVRLIRKLLGQPLPGISAQLKMSPQHRRIPELEQTPQKAGVLLLLYPRNDDLTIIFTKRTTYDGPHSGQISFPGGSQEGTETPVETALREAREELGLDWPVQILGSLTCLYIPPSDFEVYPVVGYVTEHPTWKPDQTEVVEVLECPLAWLFDETHKIVEDWERNGQTIHVPWYNVNSHRVWGVPGAHGQGVVRRPVDDRHVVA